VRFDAIVVPRGAEARAIESGWRTPRPELLAVPAGAAAASRLEFGRAVKTVIVFGVCGAIDPHLRVGDAVAYARIADGGANIELDAELAAACATVCDRAPVAAANVAAFVADPAAKAALRAATGAAVIDMECAALARALDARAIRCAMVRVVSDDARGALPDLSTTYDAGGGLRPGALAAAFARTPLRGARFVAHALQALRALRATAARIAATTD
jgi:nucleoside phosphorylase